MTLVSLCIMDNLIYKHQKELTRLCKQYQVEELYVFGSATGDSFNQLSDIDFAVRFSDKIPVEDMADYFFGFSGALESTFKRKIDLVSIPALKNPVFIEELNTTKVQLYAA